MRRKITEAQVEPVRRLVRSGCCNCVDGNCLLLDDGEEQTAYNSSAPRASTADISATGCYRLKKSCTTKSSSKTRRITDYERHERS